MSDDTPDVTTALVKAASESDLTALTRAESVSRPALPLLPIPDVPSTPHLSARASPRASPRTSLRSSPRSSPRSPHPTPATSPTFAMPTEATLSFSNYVASELANGQQHSTLGVTFTAAAADPNAIGPPALPRPFAFAADRDASPPSPSSPQVSQTLAHSRPDESSDSFVPASFDEAHAIPPSKVSLPKLELSALEPRPEPTFHPPHAGRYGKLACIQLDEHGESEDRHLTRAEILQEARATLSKSQPSPTAISKWLSNAGGVQSPSPELMEFTNLFRGYGRKATQKALRDYLRNSLQARDIRQVDPAFAAKPALWVRHSALVVSLEGLRAIILHNKMFLFAPESEKTQNLAFIAQQSIKARPDAENVQPFEFKALEGILIFLAMSLEGEFGALKPDIEKQLKQLPNELTTKMLEELRLKKQQLNNFQSRASSVKNILENVLDEDEEMANMYLTEKHTSNKGRQTLDHNEIETLLEAYLQVIDENVNQSTLLNDAIDDTENLVMIHLDTLRNRLLSVELALSVVNMTFALGGVCAGLFGMNLEIPLFKASTSKSWFLVVVVGILTVMVGVAWLVLVALRRRGLYSFY